jgi:hypothetical protein
MRDIVKNGKYKHFKGNMYQVIDIAYDSETKEEMVIYKALYNDTLWVREKKMFLSEVDKEKYPEITQKYRFELIEN